ncbi:type II toxin-antitoxin system RelE/ParE family toxin [Alteromonas sp. KUL49]|uniref:type II toxin-antitoxin system RelE/ParE family toxin n=1 Tax=Alteromonas sp. KUL49 TaxID=2480798 RepID=UPI00102EDC35|nr:type II toxin-antitoxin system RelE/ParE family toxin [Alteromonas sp. KUL49]TAP37347.1 type II toxin-antitoxin system RelE/ParE family toxin [Alteromonas sp. KUL49]
MALLGLETINTSNFSAWTECGLQLGYLVAIGKTSALAAPRDDIKKGCFSSIVSKHTIIFRKFEYGIRVIRVLHQSMDFARHIG